MLIYEVLGMFMLNNIRWQRPRDVDIPAWDDTAMRICDNNSLWGHLGKTKVFRLRHLDEINVVAKLGNPAFQVISTVHEFGLRDLWEANVHWQQDMRPGARIHSRLDVPFAYLVDHHNSSARTMPIVHLGHSFWQRQIVSPMLVSNSTFPCCCLFKTLVYDARNWSSLYYMATWTRLAESVQTKVDAKMWCAA